MVTAAKAISPKPPKIQTANGTAICCMTSSNVKTAAEPSHVVAVLNSLHFRFAVKQSQFGKFLLFFPLPILHLFVVVHVFIGSNGCPRTNSDSVARLARLMEIAEEIENVYVMETVE